MQDRMMKEKEGIQLVKEGYTWILLNQWCILLILPLETTAQHATYIIFLFLLLDNNNACIYLVPHQYCTIALVATT